MNKKAFKKNLKKKLIVLLSAIMVLSQTIVASADEISVDGNDDFLGINGRTYNSIEEAIADSCLYTDPLENNDGSGASAYLNYINDAIFSFSISKVAKAVSTVSYSAYSNFSRASIYMFLYRTDRGTVETLANWHDTCTGDTGAVEHYKYLVSNGTYKAVLHFYAYGNDGGTNDYIEGSRVIDWVYTP